MILKLLRVYQWPKNLLVFAGLLFVFPESLSELSRAIFLFIAFCCASSFVYIVNDLADKKRDARHATKKHRPIAKGAVGTPLAITIAIALLIVTALLSMLAGTIAAIIVAAYLAFNLAYSSGLKHVPYLDVLILASGYVFRVLAGTEGIGIPISEWMFIVTFFGALMIGIGKRYAETELHGSRLSTRGIGASDLKLMTLATATLTIATYAIYAQSQSSPLMLASIIPFTTAILRYIPLIETNDDPTNALFTSKTILVSGFFYVLLVLLSRIPV